MAKYKILQGAFYDRSAKKMVEVGGTIDFTEAEAKAYGLKLLSKVGGEEAPKPVEQAKEPEGSPDLKALLEEIKPLPAAEAVEKFNALEGVENVSSKVAAIEALEAMIKAQ